MGMLDDFAPDVDFNELGEDGPGVETSKPEVVAEVIAEVAEVAEPAEVETPAEVDHEPPEPVKPPKGFVPHGALAEARAKAREEKERFDQERRESAERYAKLEARIEAMANPPKPVPTFEENPAENLRAETESIRKKFEPVQAELDQFRQQQEMQKLEGRISAAVTQSERAFVAENPDYYDAIAHFQRVQNANLEVMGMTDPAQRAQTMRRNVFEMSARALHAGQSPAELAFKMATIQGYVRNADPQVADSAKTIANANKGQVATPSMPRGGKSEPKTTFNLGDLENMDENDVEMLMSDPAKWDAFMRSAK